MVPFARSCSQWKETEYKKKKKSYLIACDQPDHLEIFFFVYYL